MRGCRDRCVLLRHDFAKRLDATTLWRRVAQLRRQPWLPKPTRLRPRNNESSGRQDAMWLAGVL